MKLKAREEIKTGDLVIRLWFNWCRSVKSKDTPVLPLGVSMNNASYGELVDVLISNYPESTVIYDVFEVL